MLDSDETLTKIEPEPFHQDPKSKYYDMTASKHGLALIFNNEHFKYHEQRVGTARDEENIRQACYFLGYRPIVCRQYTKEKFLELFKNLDSFIERYTDDKDKVANDSLLCFFLSHGKEGGIFTSDSKNIPIKRVEELVGESKKLSSRPKIFFIQACQGSSPAEPTERLLVRDGDGYTSRRSDIYIFYATVSGEPAFRHKITGSWFVTEVCFVLCKFAMCKSVYDLQLELNERIPDNDPANPDSADYRYDDDGALLVQQPTGHVQLRRRVHFFNEKIVT